jgi:hypothetical protein
MSGSDAEVAVRSHRPLQPGSQSRSERGGGNQP